MSKKILYICGSMNQTTMMYKISRELPGCDHYFTPFYTDNWMRYLQRKNYLDFTVMGGQFKRNTENFLKRKKVNIDYGGQHNNYDLVLTCSDLIIQKNIRNKKIVLVQEGMTDPENMMYYLVKYLKLPRYLASTSTTGLSHNYDKFCVASDGYRDLFIKKGIDPQRLVVTGIPNFDNIKTFLKNDFPHKDYVLVATSDTRETMKYDNRKKFFAQIKDIRGNRPLIFRLHPNENSMRSRKEILEYFPDALVFSKGNTEEMIANCDELITQYSSVVYVGIVLGKKVHSYFDINELKQLTPWQNEGTSAVNIARVCIKLLWEDHSTYKPKFKFKHLLKTPAMA